MEIAHQLVTYLYGLPYLDCLTLFLLVFITYKRLPAIYHFLVLALYFASLMSSMIFWYAFIFTFLICNFSIIRRFLVTKSIIGIIKKLGLLPKISETEKIALTSGTIWVDGQLFSGKPDFKWMMNQPYPKLSKAEKSFLDNEVEEVCKMCSDYDVQKNRDLSKKVWKYLADKKFFGMIIPKKYGGLGFSAFGHSAVVEKLASRSVPLGITVMVPNSLGPAELLMHYGTKDQQDHYLPRLASGEDLPCFALTETMAGSDATSISSNGVIFKDRKGEVKIRLNFSKRYITLGAYATVIGLAFQLRDPDNIISDKSDLGITCALIPHKTKGVKQGRRHDPLATPFVNSPLDGQDVVISLDDVIGGRDGLGNGWKMLMESLAAGRGISLPSTSSGGSKLVSRVASSYCTLRQQFGLSIAKFEGIDEVLARIFSRTYALDAMRGFTAGSVDSGAKPAVVSAIAKYHSTEMFRQNINDGMDVIGGRGIIRGPRNVLANAYFSTPISITVEGANIVTRSLIHFGQGAIMCHPYAYKEIEALEQGNLKNFDKAFFSHVGHLASNLTRSILLSLTRGYISKPFGQSISDRYQRKIVWCSATFAFLADIALAKFGGNLKRKEKINGRFGDVLSAMYIATSILRKYQNDGKKLEDQPMVEHALREQLNKAQNAINGLYQNLFGKLGKILLLPFSNFARLNAFVCPADDNLGSAVVKSVTENNSIRDSLTKGIFVSFDPDDNVGRLENALVLFNKSSPLREKIKQAIRKGNLPSKRPDEVINEAYQRSIITRAEKNFLESSNQAIIDAMEVDEYSLDQYKKI